MVPDSSIPARQPNCPFCIELSDPESSDFRRLFTHDELLSRTLAEDSKFALIAGLGSFRAGYLLLVPKRHWRRFSELPPEDAERAELWHRSAVANLRRHFGDVTVFEHGGTGENAAGGCIDHAHLHLVPSSVDSLSELDESMPHIAVSGLAVLPGAVGEEPYVLAEQGGDMRAYLPRKRLPSQFMRRLLLTLEGQPDMWDWALFPGKANILSTMKIAAADPPGTWTPDA